MKEANIEFKKIEKISEKDFKIYIEEKKQEILKFHIENNNFYKNLLQNKTNLTWENLPVLTKKDFQKPLKERLSKGFEKKVYINKTSGSSGEPFVFAKDKFCHAFVWVCSYYYFLQHGVNINKSFQARFYGYPLNFKEKIKLNIKDFFANRYRFPIMDLSEKSLFNFVKLFSAKKINYINGYTSSLIIFSKFLIDKNIVLKNVCKSLKICAVTSEMLFNSDRKIIETAFGVPVINEYGAAEVGIIAFENTNKEWIINTESLFVEILNDNNLPVANGVVGNIVITSLYNKAHPFIRYKIGDLGSISKINNKKWVLYELCGRTNDVIKLPSGKIVPGMAFYVITKKLLEEDNLLKEFVIEQTKLNTFNINYVSEKTLTENVKQKFSKIFENFLESNLIFNFIQQENLVRTKSGKLKQFTSNV